MLSLKVKFRKSRVFPVLNGWWVKRINKKWKDKGSPLPPPHEAKQKIITDFLMLYPVNVFIETGTYTGKMILMMLRYFEKIISIELDLKLAEAAKLTFSDQSHVTIYQGDSGELLGDILKSIHEPCIFWLDGHYSGGVTAEGKSYTPILDELDKIFKHSIKDHVILIDDVHCFVDDDEYPSPESIEELVATHLPNAAFKIESNIICIFPAR
ncbi:MAG: class I SAM-dependent methyltransferase [Gammaproteobacteria bacterium]|nr:class I SAM-dependent methyltransferase [Gammaproteobacteria bacterium]